MIAYRDFVPAQISAPGLMKPAKYQSFAQVLEAANGWIQTDNVDIINIETVVLPNLFLPHGEASVDPNIVLQPGFAETWNQFIRVWYRVG